MMVLWFPMLLFMVMHMCFGMPMFLFTNIAALEDLGVGYNHFVLLAALVMFTSGFLTSLMVRRLPMLGLGMSLSRMMMHGVLLLKLLLQVVWNALGGMTLTYLAAMLQGNGNLLHGSEVDSLSTTTCLCMTMEDGQGRR